MWRLDFSESTISLCRSEVGVSLPARSRFGKGRANQKASGKASS